MKVLLLKGYCLRSQLRLKYCYRSNRIRGTITSGFKQPKYTQQRSARWIYSQSAQSIDLVLRGRWRNCNLLSDVKSHEGGLHMQLYCEYINRWKLNDPNFDSLSSRDRLGASHCPWSSRVLCIRRPSIDDRRLRCRPLRRRRGVITVLVVVLTCNNEDEWSDTVAKYTSKMIKTGRY